MGDPERPEERGSLLRRTIGMPRNVLAIGLVSMLNDASSEIIYPLLPVFLSLSLGASPAVIGLIEGAAESVSSLLKLVSGALSDRMGRRKELIVAGYGVAAVARTGLALANSWPMALGLRVFDRVGKGIRGAPRDALLADSARVGERGLAFGFHRAMDHTGAVIGPLVGFLLLWWVALDANAPSHPELTTIFLIAAIPAALSVLVAVLAVREVKTAEGTGTKAVPRLSLAGFDGNFRWYLGTLALFTLSNSTDAFLLLRATSAGVSTYSTRTGALSWFSTAQVCRSTVPESGNSWKRWNAATAFFMLEPDAPSISPGEKRARSSRTCARGSAALLDAEPRRSTDAGSLTIATVSGAARFAAGAERAGGARAAVSARIRKTFFMADISGRGNGKAQVTCFAARRPYASAHCGSYGRAQGRPGDGGPLDRRRAALQNPRQLRRAHRLPGRRRRQLQEKT